MNITYENYDRFIISQFQHLPNQIDIKENNMKLTAKDFDEVFHTVEARNAKNVIYIWRCERKIPRLKGKSNIVYIGQTSKSLFSRHGSANTKANSKANKQKYNDIVEQYGPIRISYIELDAFGTTDDTTLLTAEGQCLWWYFRNHSEYPPINYTKTKIRNEELQMHV